MVPPTTTDLGDPPRPVPVTSLQRPPVVLGALVFAFTSIFGFLTWRQQSGFNAFGFDLGIHDQAIWLAAHGHRLFDTIPGIDYFGQNVNLISMAFVPFYWLGAGPHFLALIHTTVLAAGAIPVWLIARDRLADGWTALVPAVAYLLYPALSFMAWWDFHPDSLSILPLLFAWWFATHRRWLPFAACCLAALACKEDVAVALVGMGIVVAFWRRFTEPSGAERSGSRLLRVVTSAGGTRQAGLMVVVVAIAWFELCTKVVIPANNAGLPPFYSSFFPAFGTTPTQVTWNALRHPSRLWDLATTHSRTTYFVQMFAPVGFLCALCLPAFLVGLPQLAINVANQADGLSFDSQYGALVLVGVFIATVEALGWIRHRWSAMVRPACALLLFTTAGSAAAWGISPLGVHFHTYWPEPNPATSELRHALTLVPAGAGVSVSYDATTHVTHRVDAFEFPNPWVRVNWLSSAVPGRPAAVSWIVMDSSHDSDPVLLARLTGPEGPFQVVYREAGVIAAERVRPGP